MGICHTKRSIEEIIHSKYTLAKDSKKTRNSQSNHVYIWKYTADALDAQGVMYYQNQTGYFEKINSLKNKNLREPNQMDQNEIEQHIQADSDEQNDDLLIGQPLKWPFKVKADEGYIILEIRSRKRQLQYVLDGLNDQIKEQQDEQILKRFSKKKVSLQILQILYMIHLESYKSYFFSEIKPEKPNQQFEASIEVVSGDLLNRIDCLKLVSISFQLQKYLKAGGQNVLKKFFNQHDNIFVIDIEDDAQILAFDNPAKKSQNQNQKPGNSFINEVEFKSIKNKGNESHNMLQIQRVLSRDIKKVKESQSYKNQEQKQAKINKLTKQFYTSLSKFHIIRTTLLNTFQLLQDSINQQRSYREFTIKKQLTINLVQKYKQNHKQNQNILIVQEIQLRNVGKQIHYDPKNIKISNLSDFDEKQIQGEEDISMIENKNQNGKNKPNRNKQDLNQSSPFMCEITEINGLQDDPDENDMIVMTQNRGLKSSQKGGLPQTNFRKNRHQQILTKNGEIDESMFLPKQLQELKIDRNLYKIYLQDINSPSNDRINCPIILTTYAGSSQYQQLLNQNIVLMINFSPNQCYNYFIHDISYQWYYLQPLNPTMNSEQLFLKDLDHIDQHSLYLFNIQCLVFEVIDKITTQLEKFYEETKPSKDRKLCLFCNHANMIYSGTFAVAYLMFSNQFRYTFQQAYETLKSSTKNKFLMPKIYETQLRNLHERIQSASSTFNLNSLNSKSSSYRAYENGLYSKKDSALITSRYIGQLTSSNQLQLLSNYSLKSYFLVPNNLTSIIIKTINVLREDNSILSSGNHSQKLNNISKLIKNMGLSLRFFCGKDLTNNQKQIYLRFVRQTLLGQLVRLEYINFPKKIFNVQKYKVKLELIIDSLKELIVLEYVQKSFRKPNHFDQQPLSVIKDIDLLKTVPSLEKTLNVQPFNGKETLTFKYPILRPIFQNKKKDSYYFMIRKSYDASDAKGNGMGCNVTFYKGQNWIGLEEDKQRYFQKIVSQYLQDISEQRIWIEDNDQFGVQKSLFDGDSMMF